MDGRLAWAVATCVGVTAGLGCRTETTSRAASELGGDEPAAAAATDTPDVPSEGVSVSGMPAALASLAKKHAAQLLREDVEFRGELEQGKRADHLLVLKSVYCYRIFGVGGPEVEDLDLAIFDPDGVQVQRDLGQDPYPILGKPVNLCPPAPGAYRLQVGMYAGTGPYLVGVYRTP